MTVEGGMYTRAFRYSGAVGVPGDIPGSTCMTNVDPPNAQSQSVA